MSRPNKPLRKSRQWEGFPLDAKGRFNGKPLAHWDREAKKFVVEGLVRASMVDTRSIIGKKASDRLLALAEAEDPVLFQEVLDERARCQAGLQLVMADMLGHPTVGRAMQAAGFRQKKEKETHAIHRVRATGRDRRQDRAGSSARSK